MRRLLIDRVIVNAYDCVARWRGSSAPWAARHLDEYW
jgi:hypothetical protein